MSTTTNVEANPTIPFLLFVVFLILKLTGVISWSWWWVTAPLWGGLALFLLFLIIFLLVLAVKSR